MPLPQLKYQIGDQVWIASAKRELVYETCPDCLGSGQWHCTLPNGEEFDVECARCYRGGYDASPGIICEEYKVIGGAVQCTITGVKIDGNKVEYSTDNHYCVQEEDIFMVEQQALDHSIIKTKELDDAEQADMKARGRRKGRPKKNENGEREHDPDFRSSGYARKIVRDSIREMLRWVDHAKRCKTEIDYMKMLEEEIKKRKE